MKNLFLQWATYYYLYLAPNVARTGDSGWMTGGGRLYIL